MTYFLKIIGDTKMPNCDPTPYFERAKSLFWESESRILLSDTAAGMVRKGDILIQYVPKGFANKQWAGRVVGCYRAISEVRCSPFKESFGEWDYFCEAENLCLKFSLRAKDSSYVVVDELGIPLFNLRPGIMRLTREQGEKAVAFLEQKAVAFLERLEDKL